MFRMFTLNLLSRLSFSSLWILGVLGMLGIMKPERVWAQETKMLITQTACVDIPEILSAINESPSIQNYLLSAESGYQKQSQSLDKRIKELENYIEDNYSSLTQQEINDIQEEIEYQKFELTESLSSGPSIKNMEEIILKGIYRLIKEIAEQDGISIIIEKSSAVIYNKPEVEITDKIINILSKSARQNEEELE